MERRPNNAPRRYEKKARGNITTQTFGPFRAKSHKALQNTGLWDLRQSQFVDTRYTLGYTWWFLATAFCCSAGTRGRSSVGRALEWHSRGQGFDSPRLHGWPRSLQAAESLEGLPRRTSAQRRLREHCGNSSVGRAQPCQGWGRGFESRFPLLTAGPRVEGPGSRRRHSSPLDPRPLGGRLAQLVRAPR